MICADPDDDTVRDDDDITPEDEERELPLEGTDEDDDMDVLGSLKTPFGPYIAESGVNNMDNGIVTAVIDIGLDVNVNMNMTDEGSDDNIALEGDVIIDANDGITIIDNPDVLKAKKLEQQKHFGQILGDDVMAQDMVMDDIVTEMETSHCDNEGDDDDYDDDDDDDVLVGIDTLH